MTCPKCRGFMIAEQLVEYYGPSSGWRCINCGWQRPESPIAPSRNPAADRRETRPRLSKG